MTPRATISRHRADVQRANSLTSLAKAVSSNAGGVGRQAAVIAAASGLVLTSGVAANAAPVSPDRQAVTTALELQAVPTTVTVAADANVSFERQAAVAAVAAPVVEAPAVQTVANEVAQEQAAPVAPVAQTPAPVVEAPAPVVEAPAPSVPSGIGATVAAAAQAQLGVSQDCTRLVSNALAAAGINFHGWPIGYMSLGTVVSAAQAQPGDLIYYDNAGAGVPHIAVYIGGGQAVHGGFNGGTTAIAPAELGSGGVYISLGG